MVLRSPIAWIGGKSRLAKKIAKIVNKTNHQTYVEPFAGGASVFWQKDPSQKEVLNDLNKTLMQFYRKFQSDPKPNCRNRNTRGYFKRGKARLNAGNWNICDFLAVNKNSYGGGMVRYSSVRCTDKSFKERLCNIQGVMDNYDIMQGRLKKVKLMSQDYKKIVEKYDSPKTIFYADPPFQTKTSSEYGVSLKSSSLPDLVQTFGNIQGKVIISFNDSPEVREVFTKKGFYIKPVVQQYSSNQFVKHMKTELLIANFPIN